MNTLQRFSAITVSALVCVSATSSEQRLLAHNAAHFEPRLHPQPAAQQQSDTTVITVGAPRYPGIATLVPEVSIGRGTTPEYNFPTRVEVFPLRDGSIVVVSPGTSNTTPVRVYDSAGRYLRNIGRVGGGVGEYTGPTFVVELPDGRIAIRDAAGITAFGSADRGTELFRQFAFGRGNTVLVPDSSMFGSILLRERKPGSVELAPYAFVRIRPSGAPPDTIHPPVLNRPTVSAKNETRTRVLASTRAVPFSARDFWEVSPLGHFVTGTTGRYSIDLRIAPPGSRTGSPMDWKAGDRVVSIRRSLPQVPINAIQLAEARALIEQQMQRLDSTWRWSDSDLPALKPPIANVEVGLDGRIWVRLSTTSERVEAPAAPAPARGGRGTIIADAPPTATRMIWREPTLYDVFEPDGTYIGQVAVPYDTFITVMRGEYVWGISGNSRDQFTVHRFRIVWR